MAATSSRSLKLVPLAAAQAVGLACGLIGVRWGSAIVPPEVLGSYSLLIATHLFGATATHSGFVQHVQRHWTAQSQPRAYLRLLLAPAGPPTLLLAAALAVALALFKVTADGAVAATWWLWMLAINLLAIVAHLAHAALQAEERYWAHFAMSAIASVTRSFLPLVLVVAGSATLATLGAGFFVHVVLWSLAGVWLLRVAWRRPDTPADAETIAPPSGMIGAFMGVGLFTWLATNAPRWFAAAALTPETTGYFMLALNLSSFVPTAIILVGVGYTFPPLYAASRNGASSADLLRMANRNAFAALLLGQAALLALSWCGPWLVGLIVAERYAPSMDWLLATGGTALATVSAAFYCNLLVALRREKACVWLVGISASARIALMAVLTIIGDPALFRLGLSVLVWPTVALEWWLVRRWVASAASV